VPSRARAEQALYRWLAYCADAGIPELTRLARTIDSWRAELLAYFDTGGAIPGRIGASRIIAGSIVRRLAIDAQFWVGYR
jgi:transposase